MQSAMHWWLEGYQFFPKRIENLYEMITYYRQKGKCQLAYMFYNMAIKQMLLNPNPDYLFLQRDIYDYKLDYEFSVFGYYCNIDNLDLTRICMKVLNHKNVENNIARNVMSNYKFYAKKLTDKRDSSFSQLALQSLADIGKNLISSEVDGALFVSSTPSLVMHKDKLVINVRYVNYRINERGGYENRENITTKNVLCTFDSNWIKGPEKIMQYDSSLDNLYVGLEDVRLFSTSSKLLYNCNRGLGQHKLAVEHGEILESTVESCILSMPGQREIEKNWVLFEDANGALKCIYNWNDLIVGDIMNSEFVKTHNIVTPHIFKYFRGSTNGVKIGNEIWFICHIVSYEDRRYYYHVFVTLDAETYEVRRWTPFFTFDGDKVEYTLGFVYRREGNQLLIGYSKMDNSTHYLAVKKSTIEGMM
jgi:hypothetical protein